MCLSTVYINSGNDKKKIMKGVAQMEGEGKGYWMIDLLGEKKFIEGNIESMNLMDGYVVVRRTDASD